MLGEPQQAAVACATGLAVDPDDAEFLFRGAEKGISPIFKSLRKFFPILSLRMNFRKSS